MKRYFCLFLLFISFYSTKAATDARSDSFDVKKYIIHLNVSDFAKAEIKGYTDVAFSSVANNLGSIRLDLYKLKVDSVVSTGLTTGKHSLSYNYNDSELTITLANTFAAGTSEYLRVYYHGVPTKDPGGFGGFVFDRSDSGYAYNLGVALKLQPHTFGRGWFPCVDNFTDKALFEFYIKTKHSHKAFCNGLLEDSSMNTDGTWNWHWKMNQVIVPYLASVAAGNYATVFRQYTSAKHSFPLICGVPPADTSAFRNGFIDFNTTMAGFEKAYGSFRFDRAGYVGVPFNNGAMEHATNIALPIYGFTNQAYSTLWAHELSHHWWGDLMTCSSAEDMWLNEGWASYSESLYEENVKGKKAYNDYARVNHYNVLRSAYLYDNGYRAISPMPQDYTYGRTVYLKGADAARTLRGYLGDSLFFPAIQAFLDTFAFKSASSDDFRKSLILATGKDSLINSYFKNWIFSPGFPHFDIDSIGFTETGMGLYSWNARVIQGKSHSPTLFSNVPVEISFFDSNWRRTDYTYTLSGASTLLSSIGKLSFKPVFTTLDIDGKITDATTKEYKTIKGPGSYHFNESLMDIKVNTVKDSALLFIAHHWIGPDRGNLPAVARISTERYWTVDGIWPAGFDATATIVYDGQVSTDYNTGFLDKILINKTEDSLRLLYREDAQHSWREYPTYKKTMGAKLDKYGQISVTHIKKGQYALAMSGISLGIDKKKPQAGEGFTIYPNPASEAITIKLSEPAFIRSITILDLQGNILLNITPAVGQSVYTIPLLHLASGNYIALVKTMYEEFAGKFVITR
jgi:hypothetical protein